MNMKETEAVESSAGLVVPGIPPKIETDAEFEAWLAEPIPQHAQDAINAYMAELDMLLAYQATNPDVHCVAYRGSQRIGVGTDHHKLFDECLTKYPDQQFCVYGITANARFQDTVI